MTPMELYVFCSALNVADRRSQKKGPYQNEIILRTLGFYYSSITGALKTSDLDLDWEVIPRCALVMCSLAVCSFSFFALVLSLTNFQVLHAFLHYAERRNEQVKVPSFSKDRYLLQTKSLLTGVHNLRENTLKSIISEARDLAPEKKRAIPPPDTVDDMPLIVDDPESDEEE